MFLKRLWPLFVETLRAELQAEHEQTCEDFRERSHDQLCRGRTLLDPSVLAALSGDD